MVLSIQFHSASRRLYSLHDIGVSIHRLAAQILQIHRLWIWCEVGQSINIHHCGVWWFRWRHPSRHSRRRCRRLHRNSPSYRGCSTQGGQCYFWLSDILCRHVFAHWSLGIQWNFMGWCWMAFRYMLCSGWPFDIGSLLLAQKLPQGSENFASHHYGLVHPMYRWYHTEHLSNSTLLRLELHDKHPEQLLFDLMDQKWSVNIIIEC